MKNGVVIEAAEGTPQGGPLSPLLANILLDELDKELEKRGHRFVRYADDCNIYVKSKRTGERVIASIRKFLQKRLKLKVNEQKSAVDRLWKLKFLEFSMYKAKAGQIHKDERVGFCRIDRGIRYFEEQNDFVELRSAGE